MNLSFGLRANAVFSFVTGFPLAVLPATVGGWLDVSIDGWLRLLGLALIAHGVLLMWVATQPSILAWGKLNLVAIAPYPLMMLGLVVTGLVDSSTGRWLVLLDGAVVGALAVVQFNGLRTATDEAHPVPA